MQVDFDGLRKNMYLAYKRVKHARSRNRDVELTEALTELGQLIGALLCCYHPDPEEKMSDMSELAENLFKS